jgi:hypothetical protein
LSHVPTHLNMTLKIPICVAIVDLLLYLLLFRSGVVLPLINPSIEEFQRSGPGFPRDFMQQLIWIVPHSPASVIIGDYLLGPRFLALSVIQPVLIGLGLGWYIDHKRGFKPSFRFSLRSGLVLVSVFCVLCFLFYLTLR